MPNHTEDSPATHTHEAASETSPEVDELSKLTQQLKEAEQKYVYLYADFENFKKRSLKEKQDAIKFGWERVATDLIAVLDNLERALQFVKPETDANFVSGLKMVLAQFFSSLEKQGVQVIQAIGQPFNPELHEAMGQVQSPQPAGTIVEEHLKGYTLHGRLLRPSRVLVSSGPAH